MSIECAFHGFVPADAESRTSQSGKLWVRLRVGVGKDDAMQWVSVAVFGKAAETAAEIKKGDRIYCEGTIKIDSWRGGDGADKHAFSVSSFKIEKTHQIGRARPKRDKPQPSGTDAGLNDDIPF